MQETYMFSYSSGSKAVTDVWFLSTYYLLSGALH